MLHFQQLGISIGLVSNYTFFHKSKDLSMSKDCIFPYCLGPMNTHALVMVVVH